ncbi:TPR repeat-containing protein [Pedosphaera parvula Ellin514]|uniref:TPR repeat-containing protein n=2 Tax=Pedosphaera TaxID=1032526 RepID=B9XNH7_PEDPL|nr:TPR repeat-containing protein [Pedosphaera parvula Ellin514]
MKQLVIVLLFLGVVSHHGLATEPSPQDLARQLITAFNAGQKNQFTPAALATNELILQKAEKDYPDDPSIHSALGACYMAQENMPACVGSMEKAYVTSKHDPRTGMMYALALKMNKELSKAYSVDKEMVAEHPDIPQLQFSLATLEMTIQKYDEAVAILEPLWAKAPANLPEKDKGTINFMLGLCYLYNGQHAKAISSLENANSHFPNAGMIYNVLGEAYLKGGEPDKAKDFLEKALAINPKLPSALYYRGICLERSGDSEHANKCFQECYRFGKDWLRDNGEDYYLMAQVCSKISKQEEADDYRKQASQLLYTYQAPWKKN